MLYIYINIYNIIHMYIGLTSFSLSVCPSLARPGAPPSVSQEAAAIRHQTPDAVKVPQSWRERGLFTYLPFFDLHWETPKMTYNRRFCVYVYVYVYVYICIYIYIYCICICLCTLMCVCVSVWLCQGEAWVVTSQGCSCPKATYPMT